MNKSEKIGFVKDMLKTNGFKIDINSVNVGLLFIEAFDINIIEKLSENVNRIKCFNNIYIENMIKFYKALAESKNEEKNKDLDEINEFIYIAAKHGFTIDEINKIKDSKNLRKFVLRNIN